MNMENIFSILFTIISKTPFWVWVLLIFLIKRGILISQERKVNISKSFIAPIIFAIWGLEKIFNQFIYIGSDLLTYIVLIPLGTFIGFKLYKNYQRYFLKEDCIYKMKCYLPLIIIIVNFTFKYILNIAIGADPHLSSNIIFNIIYSAISGASVGLFLGGILNTYMETRKVYRMES